MVQNQIIVIIQKFDNKQANLRHLRITKRETYVMFHQEQIIAQGENKVDRKDILTDYIKNEILHNNKVNLTEEQDLLSEGILDSLGILQLVSFIDQTFKIDVPDQDVVYENFHSIRALTDYLSQY